MRTHRCHCTHLVVLFIAAAFVFGHDGPELLRDVELEMLVAAVVHLVERQRDSG
jgi:hypothetical protein